MSAEETAEPPDGEALDASLRLGATAGDAPIDAKFLFTLEALLAFLFPENLQHPLAASRLIIFGLYGPLDAQNRLRSGRKGEHALLEYELDAMCQQIEREDLVQIYLHRPRDMGLLTVAEQDALINQADAHLKKAKGSALLPRVTQVDVILLFEPLRRHGTAPDGCALLSFHEAQRAIAEYRAHRVAQFKRVFPALTNRPAAATGHATSVSATAALLLSKHSTTAASQAAPAERKALTLRRMMSTHEAAARGASGGRVGPHIAPPTMFERNAGHTTADLIEQNTKLLSKLAYKVTDIDGPATAELTANVKLLREVAPRFDNPYAATRGDWNSSALLRGAGLGSMVGGVQAGASTWKRKYTAY
eukprot:gene18469-13289_t